MTDPTNNQSAESTAPTETTTDQAQQTSAPAATQSEARPTLTLKTPVPDQTQSENTPGIEVEDQSDASTLPKKFKTVADMTKSYGDLEKRAKELEAKVKESPQAPESYDFTEVFKAEGLQWQSDEQAKGWTDLFKKNRIPQDAATELVQAYAKQINGVAAQYGTPVDDQAEVGKLQKEWGADTASKIAAGDKWAAANLHPDILRYPLMQTAAGRKFAKAYMDANGGASLIREDGESSGEADLMDIREKYTAILNDPESKKKSDKGRALVAEANRLIEREHAIKARQQR